MTPANGLPSLASMSKTHWQPHLDRSGRMSIAVKPMEATIFVGPAGIHTFEVLVGPQIGHETAYTCAIHPANTDGTIQ
jgi:hypothetical protein